MALVAMGVSVAPFAPSRHRPRRKGRGTIRGLEFHESRGAEARSTPFRIPCTELPQSPHLYTGGVATHPIEG